VRRGHIHFLFEPSKAIDLVVGCVNPQKYLILSFLGTEYISGTAMASKSPVVVAGKPSFAKVSLFPPTHRGDAAHSSNRLRLCHLHRKSPKPKIPRPKQQTCPKTLLVAHQLPILHLQAMFCLHPVADQRATVKRSRMSQQSQMDW
jgi:hypothetical protein